MRGIYKADASSAKFMEFQHLVTTLVLLQFFLLQTQWLNAEFSCLKDNSVFSSKTGTYLIYLQLLI